MKNKKLLTIAAIMASAMLFLSGCVQHTASGKPYGFVYDNLAVPTQHVLVWLSQILGNSLGWAIIVITFIVRLVLMPIMIKQSKNATVQQEKIAHIKPLMEDITKRQKEATSDAERMAINQEMMQLYRDNNISMTGGIGCLPLLIQMPIFAALYAAIQYSPELSRSYFYGINLGQPNAGTHIVDDQSLDTCKDPPNKEVKSQTSRGDVSHECDHQWADDHHLTHLSSLGFWYT